MGKSVTATDLHGFQLSQHLRGGRYEWSIFRSCVDLRNSGYSLAKLAAKLDPEVEADPEQDACSFIHTDRSRLEELAAALAPKLRRRAA